MKITDKDRELARDILDMYGGPATDEKLLALICAGHRQLPADEADRPKGEITWTDPPPTPTDLTATIEGKSLVLRWDLEGASERSHVVVRINGETERSTSPEVHIARIYIPGNRMLKVVNEVSVAVHDSLGEGRRAAVTVAIPADLLDKDS